MYIIATRAPIGGREKEAKRISSFTYTKVYFTFLFSCDGLNKANRTTSSSTGVKRIATHWRIVHPEIQIQLPMFPI